MTIPAGTRHTFAVRHGSARMLAIMTPEIDALIEGLHDPNLSEQERSALWSRHNTKLMG